MARHPWKMPLTALLSILPFQVGPEIDKHPWKVPFRASCGVFGETRLEMTTHPCLFIWGVWPSRYTGSPDPVSVDGMEAAFVVVIGVLSALASDGQTDATRRDVSTCNVKGMKN